MLMPADKRHRVEITGLSFQGVSRPSLPPSSLQQCPGSQGRLVSVGGKKLLTLFA